MWDEKDWLAINVPFHPRGIHLGGGQGSVQTGVPPHYYFLTKHCFKWFPQYQIRNKIRFVCAKKKIYWVIDHKTKFYIWKQQWIETPLRMLPLVKRKPELHLKWILIWYNWLINQCWTQKLKSSLSIRMDLWEKPQNDLDCGALQGSMQREIKNEPSLQWLLV